MTSNESSEPKIWTEEKTVKLIHAFRSRPVLWDSTHQMYFKKTAKPAMWNEINLELNISTAQCKNKIVNLMSGFRREKAKMLRILSSLGGNWTKDMDYKLHGGWFAFKELGFLMYKDVERIRIESGEPINTDTDFENLKKALLDVYSKRSRPSGDVSEEDSCDGIEIKHVTSTCPTKSEPNPDWAIKPASPSSEDLEDTYISDDNMLISSPQPGPSYAVPIKPVKRKADEEINKNSHHEEINFFANFIASKMKNYSEVTKNAVQKEICEIIFKADQHYFETVASGSHFVVYDPLVSTDRSKKQKRQ